MGETTCTIGPRTDGLATCVAGPGGEPAPSSGACAVGLCARHHAAFHNDPRHALCRDPKHACVRWPGGLCPCADGGSADA